MFNALFAVNAPIIRLMSQLYCYSNRQGVTGKFFSEGAKTFFLIFFPASNAFSR